MALSSLRLNYFYFSWVRFVEDFSGLVFFLGFVALFDYLPSGSLNLGVSNLN